MEKIPTGAQRSFLYSGCYAALGNGSLAQRAAWGLRGTSNAKPFPALAANAEHSRPPCQEKTSTRLLDVTLRRTLKHCHAMTARRHALRKGRFSWEFRPMMSRERWVLRSNAAGKRILDLKPYRRIWVVASGKPLACMIFRGRVFVAPAASRRD
jgi:hypothetical protein